MINVGIMGVGNFGNQVAQLCALENFPSIAINSSIIDLETVDGDISKIAIGENGCGKNRSQSKILIKKEYQHIIAEVKEKFETVKAIGIAGSSGGGTGSGALAILSDIIKMVFPDKKIIVITTFPREDEDIKSLKNTIDLMSELKDLNLPIYALDNGKVKSNNTKEIFDTINFTAVNLLRVLRGDFNNPSPYGNMDENDRLRIFTTPGFLTFSAVSGIRVNDLDDKNLNDIIIQSLKDNLNVNTQRDKVIQRLGVIYTVSEDILNHKNGYDKLKEFTGVPTDVFEHINISDNASEGSIITICSGLSFPDNKLMAMREVIESKKEELRRREESKIKEISSGLNWLDDDIEEVEAQPVTTENLENLFGKY